jgi:hypothetical protein
MYTLAEKNVTMAIVRTGQPEVQPVFKVASSEFGCRVLNNYHVGEILGSHGGEYEDDCFLCCCAVQSGRSLPTFQRYLLPPSSGRWVLTSETSVNFYQTTRRNIPEDSHPELPSRLLLTQTYF